MKQKDKLVSSISRLTDYLICDEESYVILAKATSQERCDKLIYRYNSHDALVEALETAKGLLNHVNCPQCDGAGAYYDGGGDVCQCQWCYEKGNVEAALAAIKEVE